MTPVAVAGAVTLAVQTLTAMAMIAPSVLAPVAAPDLGLASQSIGFFASLTYLGAMLSGLAYLKGRRAPAEIPHQGNPSELRSAIFFAAVYSGVKFATAFTLATFSASALYAVAAISGLTDMDAITISISESVRNQSVAVDLGWRVIVVAILSNLVFKWGCVMALGSNALRLWISLLFASATIAGTVLLFAWPK